VTPPVAGYDSYTIALTPSEFTWISEFIYAHTGIVMKEGKQTLVTGRLGRRLRHHGLSNYSEYFRYLRDPNDPETRVAIDLLTTNETYFFREPDHFAFVREVMAQRHPGPGSGPTRSGSDAAPEPVRIWSAASSSGEEAFSLAMTLADCLPGTEWEVFGTDVSSRVVERARRGLYPLDAAAKIPPDLLHKYCLRGKAEYAGYLAVHPALTARVTFEHLNLLEPLPDLGRFEMIFLRNVMIYFDVETKRALVQRIRQLLEPGGYLVVSHSETLNGIQDGLAMIKPSVYRSVDR
jgi:chemotaxis protein methyltransferase CheR